MKASEDKRLLDAIDLIEVECPKQVAWLLLDFIEREVPFDAQSEHSNERHAYRVVLALREAKKP